MLHSLQELHVSLVLGSPELHTALQTWPPQGSVEAKDHLPPPADNTLPNAAQHTLGLLGHKGTVLARGQLVVHQASQVLLCTAAFQQVSHHPLLLQRVFLPRGRPLHFT